MGLVEKNTQNGLSVVVVDRTLGENNAVDGPALDLFLCFFGNVIVDTVQERGAAEE